MNPRFALVLAAAFACPLVAARADETRVVATHGGVVLDVGGKVARVEFVHDPKTGTVSVYGLTEPGRTLAFDAPLLALATSWGLREIQLTSIDGQVNAWKATDPSLRTDSIAGQLRLRVDGRKYTAALDASTPMQPTSFERPGGARGGDVFEIGPGAGRLEFVHEAPAGSVTIYLTPEPGTAPQITTAPVLVLSTAAGPKSVPFSRLNGEAFVWKATNFALLRTDQRLEGEIRLGLGGNAYTVSLAAPASVRTVPRERLMGLHGGVLLDLGNGLGRLEFVEDRALGTVTVFEAGRVAAFEEPPVLVVSSPSGPQRLALVRIEGTKDAWKATSPEYLKGPGRLDGEIRARVFGRAYAFALPGDFAAPDRGPHGGPIFVLGEGTRIEWLHDATLGTITFSVIDRPGATPLAFATEPSITLTTDLEPRETGLVRVEGTNSWRISAAGLKTDAIRGTFRVRVGADTYVAQFETPLTANSRVDRPLVPETGVPGLAVGLETSLGLAVAPLAPELRAQLGVAPDTGVWVRNVRAGSAADAIGLHPNDVITAVDGRKATPENVEELLRPAGKDKAKPRVEIIRGAKVITLN